jgi:hypothetical protein
MNAQFSKENKKGRETFCPKRSTPWHILARNK